MTPQEAQIIRDVFAKIRMMGPGSEDREAARAVEAEIAANPAAALGLVKVVVGLERERDALEQQAQELAAQVEDLQARAQPQSSGGLFGGSSPRSGGLFGGSAQPAQTGPWGASAPSGPWGAPQQPQGGGFWGSALRTGAGVAGGLFAFEALKGLFGGHGGGSGSGGFGPTSGLFDGGPTVVENVNIFEGDRVAGAVGDTSTGGFGGEAPSGSGFVADDIDFTGGGFDDDSFA